MSAARDQIEYWSSTQARVSVYTWVYDEESEKAQFEGARLPRLFGGGSHSLLRGAATCAVHLFGPFPILYFTSVLHDSLDVWNMIGLEYTDTKTGRVYDVGGRNPMRQGCSSVSYHQPLKPRLKPLKGNRFKQAPPQSLVSTTFVLPVRH